MLYGISPPENSPALDEWLEAHDEKRQLLKKADDILESYPNAGLKNWDDLEAATLACANSLNELIGIKSQYGMLDDMFPDNGEPNLDTDYDDRCWEGDR